MLVNDEHPENANLPIEVTLSGIVISVNDEHSSNALLPIDVTLFGILIFVNYEYTENAKPTISALPVQPIIYIPPHQTAECISPSTIQTSPIDSSFQRLFTGEFYPNTPTDLMYSSEVSSQHPTPIISSSITPQIVKGLSPQDTDDHQDNQSIFARPDVNPKLYSVL